MKYEMGDTVGGVEALEQSLLLRCEVKVSCLLPATHCNTLQHTATHCNTLQRTATHCDTLQHTSAHCNTFFAAAMWAQGILSRTPQHAATRCNIVQQTAT